MDKLTFSFGTSLKNKNEVLRVVTLDDLIGIIKEGKEKTKEQTSLVRKVWKISKDHYRNLKTELPYFSCSQFKEGSRNYTQFEMAVGIILDIDSDEELDQTTISRIKSDQRICLMYTSPNGYGKKIVLIFEKPITEKHHYQQSYKAISQHFAVQYGLVNQLDTVNSDVSRVSFISYDADCFYNPDFVAIDTDSIFDVSKTNPPIENEIGDTGMEAETYKNILIRLGTKAKPLHRRPPMVPEAITEMMEGMKQILEENKMNITKIEEIQYGIKLHLMCRADLGEVIVYHGKSGFKVVSSPKKGLSHELNEVAKQLIEYHLTSYLFI